MFKKILSVCCCLTPWIQGTVIANITVTEFQLVIQTASEGFWDLGGIKLWHCWLPCLLCLSAFNSTMLSVTAIAFGNTPGLNRNLFSLVMFPTASLQGHINTQGSLVRVFFNILWREQALEGQPGNQTFISLFPWERGPRTRNLENKKSSLNHSPSLSLQPERWNSRQGEGNLLVGKWMKSDLQGWVGRSFQSIVLLTP